MDVSVDIIQFLDSPIHKIRRNIKIKSDINFCITDHEVESSIPGTSEKLNGLSLERGPPSLVRTIG